MKAKSKLKILGICLLGICIGTTISNGAVEIKPGGTVHTNVTISQAYEYCYNMRSGTSSLGANSLDPHLSLNADWGAVAYLGLSPYGTVRDKTGKLIDGIGYTTTGNITGVIDLGKTARTYVSSLKSGATQNSSPNNRTKLTENLGTKYVEDLQSDADKNVENSRGMALAETRNWFNSHSSYDSSVPCIKRTGIVGFHYSDNSYGASSGTNYYRWCYEFGDVSTCYLELILPLGSSCDFVNISNLI